MKFLAIPLALLLVACNQQAPLSDSQIRFNKATQAQRKLIVEVDAVLVDLSGDLAADLTQIQFARELTLQAEQVFNDAKIVTKENPTLTELKAQLNAYEQPAASLAVQLLTLSLEKTIEFKKSVEKMPATKTSKNMNMLNYLSNEYNKDLKSCCFKDLNKISTFLKQSENNIQYRKLRRLINTVSTDLGNILSTPELEMEYREKLDLVNVKGFIND